LCPEKALKLTIDENKGIYVPKLNEIKCNNCGICYAVCPGHSVDFKALNLEIFGKNPEDTVIGNYLTCYVGHATNYDTRYSSSSGGFVTALLTYALEEGLIDGALVTKMSTDNPLKPEPFIARTTEDIIEACGSKYCPVPANIAIEEILNSKNGEKFAVVGLPCHIQGIRKAEQVNDKLKEKIVLHLGLFCQSFGVNFFATEYVLKKLNILKEDVVRINYRSGDFPPGIMTIEIKNNNATEISHLDFWDTAFFPSVSCFAPIRCMLCSDQNCKLSDISIGSGWSSYLENDNVNQSLILVRNKLAENLLNKCKNNQKVNLIKLGRYIASDNKQKKLKAHMFFFKLFGKRIPHYNLHESPNPTFKTYLHNVSLYMRTYFSSKRYLWGIMLNLQSFKLKICNIIFTNKKRM
jgi:coenzyme F420 hydrogenase subunit beta